MKSSLQYIENFENKYIWFGLRYNKIKIPFRDHVFIFNDKGFKCLDCDGIEYGLGEMNQHQLGLLYFLLPMFAQKIAEVSKWKIH